MIDVGQNMLGEEVGLGYVRITGQDEGPDADLSICLNLREDLIGVADDRCACTPPVSTKAVRW